MNDISLYDGSPFDAIRRVTPEGREFWSSRDLMAPLGYEKWERFAEAINRAKISAHNAGYQVSDHFPGAGKMVETGSGAHREIADYHLSRFACYLIALNGDPRKPEIAAAQAYFVIKTREAETRSFDPASLSRRDILTMAIEAEDRADREAAARIEAEQRAQALEAPASAWTHMAAAAGDYSVGDAAKILSRDPNISIGRDRLFQFMAAAGWIYRGKDRRGSWAAYQTQVDCGRLVEKAATPYLNQRTGEMELPAPTIRVAAKGLAELHKRLGGTGQVQAIASAEVVAS